MESDSWPRIRQILAEAFKRPERDRAAFVEATCAGDEGLRREVERYLESDRDSDAALPSAPTSASSVAPAAGPSPHIGRYRVKRLIGTGGMGAVYEAMQEQPRRIVALKVMKRGIGSRSALRRFEYEAQLLARLRHQGIAQVFEAGTHDDGTGPVPFFALEYIPGAKSLTAYASEKSLSTRDRLDLFALVCDAVHHGHQKGIIHRDLKPANILVDSSGQPKIIDFGVARATDSDLAMTTLQTDVGQLIGTIQYMSPEQCDADPHDIDTRSDVYTLGVVLFELLCGRLPYDVAGSSVLEAARTVRDQSPSRPSTIDKSLRGDVETIVLKALSKDRDARYRSASELADDIRRFLRNEPILARPHSLAYQFRKFTVRHRPIVAAAAAVAAVLVMAVVGISWGLFEAKRARSEAVNEARNARAINEFLRSILILPNPSVAQSRSYTVKDALGIASDRIAAGLLDGRPDVEADVRATLGATYRSLGEYALAEAHLSEALDLRVRHHGEQDTAALAIMSQLAGVKASRGKEGDAVAMLRRVMDIQERVLGAQAPSTLRTVSELAWTVYGQGDLAEAERLFRRLLEGTRATFGTESAATMKAMATLGMVLVDLNHLDEADVLSSTALELGKRNPGPRHPDYLYAQHIRAWLFRTQKEYEKAVMLYQAVTTAAEEVMGPEHPYTMLWKRAMAWCMILANRSAEAEPVFRQCAEVLRRSLGPSHRDTLDAEVGLGRSLFHQGRLEDAESIIAPAVERCLSIGNERGAVEGWRVLAALYEQTGRSEQAAALRARLPTTK